MKQFRSDIEGLRAIAILLVVGAHAAVPWLRGGFVGVDVFFVLSGFLITGFLVQEHADTGKLNLIRFYVRRMRRLLPALLFMLLGTGVAALALLSPAEQSTQSSTANMAVLWLSNFYFPFKNLDYFSPGSETNLYLHTWSLGVEEQFYLIWPALLLGLLNGQTKADISRLKAGMLTVLIASLLACVVFTYAAPLLAFYMMPMRAWQFAAGALVWLYFQAPRSMPANHIRLGATTSKVLGWSGLLFIILAVATLNSDTPYPGAWALLPTLGTVAIIAAGTTQEVPSGIARVLRWRPLQWIGRISYSWYLWHWPILLLGYALTASQDASYRMGWVTLSLGVAYLSYLLVETPLRRSRSWLINPPKAILLSLISMLVAANICMLWRTHAVALQLSPQMERYSAAHSDAPAIYGMGCDDWYHSSRVRMCTFGSVDAPRTVVLMGDSHAGQWFPALASAVKGSEWRIVVITKSSCPIVDEQFFYARIRREYIECAVWRRAAIEAVQKLRPDLLLIGNSQYEFSKDQWIEGTARILNILSPAVGHIGILRDTPSLPFDGPDCLIAHATRPAWMNRFARCTSIYDNNSAKLTYAWTSEAASRFVNVSMLDMNQQVCPAGICSAELGGSIVFRDGQHLTNTFATQLGPAFADKLRSSMKAAE